MVIGSCYSKNANDNQTTVLKSLYIAITELGRWVKWMMQR
jgi:hypothetical protein